jgi:cytochrome c oxidase subunit 2
MTVAKLFESWRGVSAGTLLASMPTASMAEWGLNLPRGVTPFSHTVYDLHMLILYVCVAIGVVVFGAMFYSIITFRKSAGAKAAQWHDSTKVELLWTLIPFLILIGMAVPATRALIMMENVAGADMTIKVTGYQWKWHYQYIDDGIAFFSTLDAKSNEARQLDSDIDPKTVENYLLAVDNHLVVPTGKKIRFLTTAGDVIHAWWVPALGWKRDAIPGFINESWAEILEPGVYRGQCTELCGKDHGFMPIVVEAVSPEAYSEWVAKMKAGTQHAAMPSTSVTVAGQ